MGNEYSMTIPLWLHNVSLSVDAFCDEHFTFRRLRTFGFRMPFLI